MNAVIEQLGNIKIVPVIKIDRAEDAFPLAKALCAGGLACAEVTFRTDAAEEAIRIMTTHFPEMCVGAGTVLTEAQADAAVKAGAKFIVSPGFNPRVVKYCMEKRIPITPGVSTPSEIEQAIELGLEVVKFFPAEQSGGLEKIKAMAAPYTGMRFMPTGGINPKNLRSYLSFPKVIACGGSWMVPGDLIKGGEWDKIEALVREAVLLLQEDGAEEKQSEGRSKKITFAAGAQSAGEKKEPAKVIAMGEIMMRLSAPGHQKWLQSDSFDVNYGGGEANVAVSLARFGHQTSFVTAVPDNEIGECAAASLRKYGVGTEFIAKCGERLGIYFLESGSSVRPSKVVYDRAHSSMATATETDFDFDAIFEGADWFHFSGITPAVSDAAAELTKKALQAAKRHGVKVSVDLNYRSKLWSPEKAKSVMPELMQYVDVCIGGREDAILMLGFSGELGEISDEQRLRECEDIFRQMTEKYHFEYCISSLRRGYSASDNGWSACAYCGRTGEFYRSREYRLSPIVDRVGGGDALSAGVICGLLDGRDFKEALEFGVAAAALKHTIPGDVNLADRREVEELVCGGVSGRVQR